MLKKRMLFILTLANLFLFTTIIIVSGGCNSDNPSSPVDPTPSPTALNPTPSPTQPPTPTPPTPDLTPPEINNTNLDAGSTILINGNASLTVSFSEPMDISTVTIDGNTTGTLGSVEDSSNWNWTPENDSVVFSPLTEWIEGLGLTLLINGSDIAGNALESEITLYYDVDKTIPTTLSILPTSNSSIVKTQNIVITFSESMQPLSLLVSGTLLAESDGGVWTQTTLENDTLTISPLSSWNMQVGSLTINCTDKAGNPVGEISIAYAVQSVFVKQGASGTTGDMGDPFGSINDAIAEANTNWPGDAAVCVAEGSYTVTSGTDHIFLVEGISLYGGYSSSDWTDRDPSVYTTSLTDNVGTSGAIDNPNRIIEGGSGITNTTIVDGFEFIPVNLSYSTNIYCHSGSAPVISNNTFTGGISTNPYYGLYIIGASPLITDNLINPLDGNNIYNIRLLDSASPIIRDNTIEHCTVSNNWYGIYSTNSVSPTIENNTIKMGYGANIRGISNIDNSTTVISGNTITGGSSSDDLYGIFCSQCGTDFTITENYIDGGSATNMAVGIELYQTVADVFNNIIIAGTGDEGFGIRRPSGQTLIYNNYINGGDCNTSYGIYLWGSTQPFIINNIIETIDGSARYGIYEDYSGSNPHEVMNNNIYNCPTALYYDIDDAINLTTISAMEADIVAEGEIASGNITETLVLDGDYRYTEDLGTVGFDTAGYDLSGIVDYDYDGENRTNPYSIGPFEYN